MQYFTFGNQEEAAPYPIAFLAPVLMRDELRRHYIDAYFPDEADSIIAVQLHKEGKRTPVTVQREFLNETLEKLQDIGTKYLVCCDGEYFKTLTKKQKIEDHMGYVLPCVIEGFQEMSVIYCPNHQQIFYDPDKVRSKIYLSLTTLREFISGQYVEPGNSIIKFSDYPKTVSEIRDWLQKLYEMDCDLAADIEAFSLHHYDAGLGTISFAWNKHEGIAFPVDLIGSGEDAVAVRGLLRIFFENFKKKLMWHNISYDVHVLISQLFMKDMLDTEGLLYGLEVMMDKPFWDCTKTITYLATNSCAGNVLGLKAQSQEFTGQYAVEDIDDITKIPLDELLEYNLIDSLATWYVYEKHYQTMVDDQQEELYETLFKDALIDIVQMQLTGLPVDMHKVLEVKTELEGESAQAVKEMKANSIIKAFIHTLEDEAIFKKNQKLKKKQVTRDDLGKTKDLSGIDFNPNSSVHLQKLLYDDSFLGLPVIDYTDSKLPATGAETLEKLKNHTTDPDTIQFLESLIVFKSIAIILSTFIPAFEKAPLAPDGCHYLFGFFNLGGTLSGRLSSSKPNLQNIPSAGSTELKQRIAKLIKMCVSAPKGWLFCGLDFDSLEDRISALTTKDPMKLKVYTDGYDGHCLRAYAYFSDQMPDIDGNSVKSINSIKKKYKPLRQESKAPTFALTYQGTFVTLMTNCGFSEQKAKAIEKAYHDLYIVSDQWVADKLQQATVDGYVTVAFGLRVRTPLLKQVVLGTKRTPFEAAAEGRTAGNALGQSYCLLNNRAQSAFMKKVRKSEYRLDIRPCAAIHDAQYYLIRDNVTVVKYANDNLVPEVQWQEDPAIAHDEVKLGGALSIFYPTWKDEIEIPNGASEQEIIEICQQKIAA